MFRNNFNFLIRLPAPLNISYIWNFRSCLRILITCQIITGFFLSCFILNYRNIIFYNLTIFIIDNSIGWLFRFSHTVRSSFIILFLYIHIRRRIYYKRYVNIWAWFLRVILMILTILIAFLRYVLPWRQISYWRATVITNLLSTLPYRSLIVNWLWRRFVVNNYTLNRFYSLHFLLPFIIIVFSMLHLLFIHNLRSRSSLRHFSSIKLDFWGFFGLKDLFRFYLIFFIFFFFLFLNPYIFFDTENFLEANNIVTPTHIKPEWYFLFAYAILRCIPNKLLRVIVLVISILIFFLIPYKNLKIKRNYIISCFFFFWIFNFFFNLVKKVSSKRNFYLHISSF